jgi:hypothetical protein
MPSQGYTVSPVFTSGEAGEEQIVDFSISENRHGNNTDVRDFQVDESHGIVTNNFQDVELSDGGDGRLPDYDFRVAIHQTYPLFDQAMSWAGNGGLDDEQIQQFDSVMNGDDPGAFYPAIEGLISQFQQSGARVQQSSPPPMQEREPQQQQNDHHAAIEESLSPIFSGQNAELSEDYEDQSHEELEDGDYMGAMLSAGLAAFHRGEVTGEVVADRMIETFGQKEALGFLAKVLKSAPN